MKNFFLILTIACIQFSVSAQSKKDSKGFLPKEFNKLYFGMSFDQFVKVKELGMVEVDKTFDFRITYTEEKPDETLKTVVYYFDRESNGPLYELIIDYNNEEERDKVANNLFATPNYEGEEWRFVRKNKFEVRAWKYQNKLIIVGVLPGTEWAKD